MVVNKKSVINTVRKLGAPRKTAADDVLNAHENRTTLEHEDYTDPGLGIYTGYKELSTMMALVAKTHKGVLDVVNSRVYEVFGYRSMLFVGRGSVYKRFTDEKKARQFYDSIKDQTYIRITETEEGKKFRYKKSTK
jgi:hypothetical protein